MIGQEDRNAPSPLDLLQTENAALREQLNQLQNEQCEWLCHQCKTIHPTQCKGRLVQPCPSCGAAMVPTSFNLREIAALREQLAAAQKDAERYQKFVAVSGTTSDEEPALHAKLDVMLCHPSKDAFDKLFDSIDLAAIAKEKTE